MPERKPWDVEIKLKDSFYPKTSHIFPLSFAEQEALKDWIDEQLAKGYIRPSSTPQTSPVFFVPKPNNGKRLVIDFGHLNSHTVRDSHPLPLIEELYNLLSSAKFFTKLDLHWGFYNIRVKEGEEWKLGIATRFGTYEFLVMPMGLCNAPAIFQRMMNEIFQDLFAQRKGLFYMDDILIAAGSLPELHSVTRIVLK
jgi:hypothetical protein